MILSIKLNKVKAKDYLRFGYNQDKVNETPGLGKYMLKSR